MIKLNGFTQLIEETEDGRVNDKESHQVYAWYTNFDRPDFFLLKSLGDNKPSSCGWETGGAIPGRTHAAFNKFYLWFEYE